MHTTNTDLTFLTCGHVDDGKSTLMGRLLYDIGVIPDDQVRGATVDGALDFSRLTDGLEDERAQGITIDVAYRFFRYRGRFYRIADTPGHIQYTRNMAVAAANSQAALVLVDAAHGVREQTIRHSRIAAMLGIRTFAIIVNKMDLVNWDEERFRAIEAHWRTALGEVCHDLSLACIPVSALHGNNVTATSRHTPWYNGLPLIEWLAQTVPPSPPLYGVRLPVQAIARLSDAERGAQGLLTGGSVKRGDRLGVAGTSLNVTVTALYHSGQSVEEAHHGSAVTLVPDMDVDLSRGTVLYGLDAPLTLTDTFAARLLWLDPTLETLERKMGIIKIHNREEQAEIEVVSTTDGVLHDVTVRAASALPLDKFAHHPATGLFLFIEPEEEKVLAVGVVTSKEATASRPRRYEVSV